METLGVNPIKSKIGSKLIKEIHTKNSYRQLTHAIRSTYVREIMDMEKDIINELPGIIEK